ncbi:hypothetical protein BDW75DRAFT_8371 [Aspergillus navahoensis]
MYGLYHSTSGRARSNNMAANSKEHSTRPSKPEPPTRSSEGDQVLQEAIPPSRFASERLHATTEIDNAISLNLAAIINDPASDQILKATFVEISFAHLDLDVRSFEIARGSSKPFLRLTSKI